MTDELLIPGQALQGQVGDVPEQGEFVEDFTLSSFRCLVLYVYIE